MYRLLDAAHAMLKISWDIWGRIQELEKASLSIRSRNIVSVLFYHFRICVAIPTPGRDSGLNTTVCAKAPGHFACDQDPQSENPRGNIYRGSKRADVVP